MAGMCSSEQRAIKLSGREEPSRKLNAEREWSSTYIGQSGHRGISILVLVKSPDDPITFSHSFLPPPIVRRSNSELADSAPFQFPASPRLPTRRPPRGPSRTSLQTSATGAQTT